MVDQFFQRSISSPTGDGDLKLETSCSAVIQLHTEFGRHAFIKCY